MTHLGDHHMLTTVLIILGIIALLVFIVGRGRF